MKKNSITEGLEMDMTTYKKVKGTLDPKTPVKITGDKPAPTSTSTTTMTEEDGVIEPQDKETIKYLSNVKDAVSGKVSQPFTIADKKYQMVRGIKPSKEIIMAVFCHDDLDESGNNLIHSVEHFEENIAKPMMQQEVMMGNDMEVKETKPMVKKEPESLNLSEFKHYLVNEKTGKFRKFKNIVELAAAVMGEDEKYMPIKEFRKFFENRVFGGKKENEMNLMEIAPTGEENDEEMSQKAQKLMQMIKTKIPQNVLTTIKTPVAKREVIAAFAEILGVTRKDLPNLINGLKDIVKQSTQPVQGQTAPTVPVTEKKVITKNELMESLKVIKTIKVKDLNNGQL